MELSKDAVTAVLSRFNPWWRNESVNSLPTWKRAAYQELRQWSVSPPARRAVVLSGARQIGKTTLMQQMIQELLERGIPAGNILYATFDHPILKLAGIDAVVEAWREREPATDGPEYLFLDEAQFLRDWGTWVKHEHDFNQDRRIIFTGSAMTLDRTDAESGVGRWHTIQLTTLSFYEYIQIKQLALPDLPALSSLRELFTWEPRQISRVKDVLPVYMGHFHEYLLRGGFPQTAMIDNITIAQQLIREDIIDKVLKRDMTANFGVRRVLDLEHTFLYLCMNDGALLDMTQLASNLSVSKVTAQRYIDIFVASHLVYRLPPFGYGKDVLRGKFKLYLADPAIAPAVMLRDKSMISDAQLLGVATEAAVFKHVFARYYPNRVQFSYWRGKKQHEVDLVAETGSDIIPFEVKYRNRTPSRSDLTGLLQMAKQKQFQRAYVVTKSPSDLGKMIFDDEQPQVMQIPAPLICYWMGATELNQAEVDSNT
jgi:predicted AAA+ superfamily ATPase